MKKMLSLVMTGICFVMMPTSVMGCFWWHRQKYETSVWIVTDAGTINDQSFNQSAWKGANAYVQASKSDSGLGKKKWDASYYEPVNASLRSLRNAYKIAVVNGAKTLVLPGFKHIKALPYASSYAENAILIDGIFQPNFGTGFSEPHVVNLVYEAEVSGIEAALAGAAYLSARKIPDQRMAVFGGMDFKTAVDNYMFGYLAGMSLWNYVISSVPKAGKETNKLLPLFRKLIASYDSQLKPQPVHLTDFQGTLLSDGTFRSLKGSGFNSTQWFSGSFALGRGRPICSKLLNDKASIIFAVAGPQVQDAVSALATHPNAKVIGADTDIGAVLGRKFILTSALKKIKQSTTDVLKTLNSDDASLVRGHTVSSAYHRSWNGVCGVKNSKVSNYDFSQDGVQVFETPVFNQFLYGNTEDKEHNVKPSPRSFVGIFATQLASPSNITNWHDITQWILKTDNGNLGKYLYTRALSNGH